MGTAMSGELVIPVREPICCENWPLCDCDQTEPDDDFDDIEIEFVEDEEEGSLLQREAEDCDVIRDYWDAERHYGGRI